MEQDHKKNQDVLRDIGDGLSEFGRKVGDKISQIMDDIGSGDEAPKGSFIPRMDMYMTASHLCIEMEMAGLSKKEVKLAATEDTITISGTKSHDVSENINYLHRERRFGEFSRAFDLPEGLDMEQVKASFKEGVLSIRIARLHPEKTTDDNITTIDID